MSHGVLLSQTWGRWPGCRLGPPDGKGSELGDCTLAPGYLTGKENILERSREGEAERDFAGRPVVKTSPSNAGGRGCGFEPWSGN